MAHTPRIDDICKKLNLSKATVSKALNGYSSVREETRRKVLACAVELLPLGESERLRWHTHRLTAITEDVWN